MLCALILTLLPEQACTTTVNLSRPVLSGAGITRMRLASCWMNIIWTKSLQLAFLSKFQLYEEDGEENTPHKQPHPPCKTQETN